MYMNINRNRGFSLVEALVMMFIATLSVFFIWRVYVSYIKISTSNPSIFQASFLAEEGIEAVKFMRDSGWNSNIAPLISGTSYTLTFENNAWGVTTTPVFVNSKFDRRVVLSEVYRDVSGNIASSGSLDQGTRKVLVAVSWQKDTGTTTREITTYVSDIFNN